MSISGELPAKDEQKNEAIELLKIIDELALNIPIEAKKDTFVSPFENPYKRIVLEHTKSEFNSENFKFLNEMRNLCLLYRTHFPLSASKKAELKKDFNRVINLYLVATASNTVAINISDQVRVDLIKIANLNKLTFSSFSNAVKQINSLLRSDVFPRLTNKNLEALKQAYREANNALFQIKNNADLAMKKYCEKKSENGNEAKQQFATRIKDEIEDHLSQFIRVVTQAPENITEALQKLLLFLREKNNQVAMLQTNRGIIVRGYHAMRKSLHNLSKNEMTPERHYNSALNKVFYDIEVGLKKEFPNHYQEALKRGSLSSMTIDLSQNSQPQSPSTSTKSVDLSNNPPSPLSSPKRPESPSPPKMRKF